MIELNASMEEFSLEDQLEREMYEHQSLTALPSPDEPNGPVNMDEVLAEAAAQEEQHASEQKSAEPVIVSKFESTYVVEGDLADLDETLDDEDAKLDEPLEEPPKKRRRLNAKPKKEKFVETEEEKDVKMYSIRKQRFMFTIHKWLPAKELILAFAEYFGKSWENASCKIMQEAVVYEPGCEKHQERNGEPYRHMHAVFLWDPKKRARVANRKKFLILRRLLGHWNITYPANNAHFLNMLGYSASKAKKKIELTDETDLSKPGSYSRVIADSIGDWSPLDSPMEQAKQFVLTKAKSWRECIRSDDYSGLISRFRSYFHELFMSRGYVAGVDGRANEGIFHEGKQVKPHEWQQLAIEIFSVPNVDNRGIIVITNSETGGGKSAWSKHMYAKYGALIFTGGQSKHLRHAYDGHPLVIFNYAKLFDPKFVTWGLMENLKDGFFFSDHYGGGMKSFRPPHVVVCCNFYPDVDKDFGKRLVVVDISDPKEAAEVLRKYKANPWFRNYEPHKATKCEITEDDERRWN